MNKPLKDYITSEEESPIEIPELKKPGYIIHPFVQLAAVIWVAAGAASFGSNPTPIGTAALTTLLAGIGYLIGRRLK